MNKITASSLNMGKEFKSFIKDMFDDNTEIESEYEKHSSCRVKLLADIPLDVAKYLVSNYGLSVAPELFVGNWIIEASSDYSNGLYWDEVDEIIKVEQVTETKIVKTWKPVANEQVPNCS